MTQVERSGGGFVVDAGLLGSAFGLTEDEVRERMRSGVITARSERGQGEDAGRWRLTFHHGSRACRLIVDDRGRVLKQARFPIRARHPDGSARGS